MPRCLFKFECGYSGVGGLISAQTKRISNLTHSCDAKGDVFLDRDGQFFRAFADIVAIDAAREGFVLEFALHRIGFDLENALSRFDQGACGQEAGKFVASKQSMFERRFARNVAVIGVGNDGANHFFRVTAFAQDC